MRVPYLVCSTNQMIGGIMANILFFVILALAPLANAHYSFQDTGDLLAPGRFAVGSELQFVTSGDNGVNILGKFDGGFVEDLNYRFIVGSGNTDLQLSALLKWVPVPDYGKQPAFGITTGVLYARFEDENELSLRVVPFTSKKFEVSFGTLTPYAALPVAVRTYDSDTDLPVQLALGSKYVHPDVSGTEFTAEIGFDIDKAFNYFSVGAIFPLDEENNFQFQK
jgi:hypothetical protein